MTIEAVYEVTFKVMVTGDITAATAIAQAKGALTVGYYDDGAEYVQTVSRSGRGDEADATVRSVVCSEAVSFVATREVVVVDTDCDCADCQAAKASGTN